MMNDLPSAVLQVLIQRVLKETSAAWLLIDSDGKLKDMGGGLSIFGLKGIEKGCVIQQQAIFLEGILSIHNPPSNIESIQIDNGEYADIYLLEEQSERWIILLGRTESSRWKGVAQQKANELELLQRKLAIRVDDSNQIDFGSLMGIIALEQNEDGSFRLLDPIPGYCSVIYPKANETNDNLHPEDNFPFLANFLEDCQVVWSAKDQGRLKSGPWIENDQDGEEYVLEATAILWQQRRLLLIEHLNGHYEEHLAVLQLGRENALNKLQLEKEILRQKLMEQSLLEARAKADRANQAKSEFLSSMSHELRTPLNAILGFSQLMLSDIEQPLTEKQQESMGYIMDGGKHLLELISQVLKISEIEAGKMDISIEDVVPIDVVEACLPIIQMLADNQQVSIKYNAQAAIVIRADSTRLKQVVINLLSNAIKYNREGGSVIIEESITDEGNFKLLIKDTGMGIPANKQDKLFTAFARLGQENSGIEGSGVGLVVTKAIIEAMNGHIGFESTEGQGSSFWIELPLAVGFDAEEILDKDMTST